jgi:hypothetical protein
VTDRVLHLYYTTRKMITVCWNLIFVNINSVSSKASAPPLGFTCTPAFKMRATTTSTGRSFASLFQNIRFSINTIRFVNRLKSLSKQIDTWIGTKCKPCNRLASSFPLYWVQISSLDSDTAVVWACRQQAYLVHPNLPSFRRIHSSKFIRRLHKVSTALNQQ